MELNDEVRFDRAMKLSAAAGVSLEDAKAALNACNFDMLDAIVYLEKLGKVKAPTTESYSTGDGRRDACDEEDIICKKKCKKHKKVTFGHIMSSFFKWCGKLIKLGNVNFIDIDRNGECIIKMPITCMVLLMLISVHAVAIIMLVGLFFGFRYNFSGPNFKKDGAINAAMDKAAKAADDIKREFSGETEDVGNAKEVEEAGNNEKKAGNDDNM